MASSTPLTRVGHLAVPGAVQLPHAPLRLAQVPAEDRFHRGSHRSFARYRHLVAATASAETPPRGASRPLPAAGGNEHGHGDLLLAGCAAAPACRAWQRAVAGGLPLDWSEETPITAGGGGIDRPVGGAASCPAPWGCRACTAPRGLRCRGGVGSEGRRRAGAKGDGDGRQQDASQQGPASHSSPFLCRAGTAPAPSPDRPVGLYGHFWLGELAFPFPIIRGVFYDDLFVPFCL